MIVLIHGAAKMAKINKYSRNERKKVIENVDEKKKTLSIKTPSKFNECASAKQPIKNFE